MVEKNDVTRLTYEQALAELETIVNTLESEQRSLEEALSLFARGQALTQHCTTLLDKAELKVRQVSDAMLETPTAED
jgi:exodeoxyribonuclease VII small subunit